jgi:hypothetical protein
MDAGEGQGRGRGGEGEFEASNSSFFLLPLVVALPRAELLKALEPVAGVPSRQLRGRHGRALLGTAVHLVPAIGAAERGSGPLPPCHPTWAWDEGSRPSEEAAGKQVGDKVGQADRDTSSRSQVAGAMQSVETVMPGDMGAGPGGHRDLRWNASSTRGTSDRPQETVCAGPVLGVPEGTIGRAVLEMVDIWAAAASAPGGRISAQRCWARALGADALSATTINEDSEEHRQICCPSGAVFGGENRGLLPSSPSEDAWGEGRVSGAIASSLSSAEIGQALGVTATRGEQVFLPHAGQIAEEPLEQLSHPFARQDGEDEFCTTLPRPQPPMLQPVETEAGPPESLQA